MIALQIILCCLVLFAGVAVQSIALRKRIQGWDLILSSINGMNGRLASLALNEMFSEGIAIPLHEIYSYIDGRDGLRAMYRNVGAFMEIAALLGIGHDPQEEVRVAQRVLFVVGVKSRLLLLVSIVASYANPLLSPALIARAVEQYLKFTALTSIAVRDFCPHLFAEFKCHVINS